VSNALFGCLIEGPVQLPKCINLRTISNVLRLRAISSWFLLASVHTLKLSDFELKQRKSTWTIRTLTCGTRETGVSIDVGMTDHSEVGAVYIARAVNIAMQLRVALPVSVVLRAGSIKRCRSASTAEQRQGKSKGSRLWADGRNGLQGQEVQWRR
jgi:hypothetical protein